MKILVIGGTGLIGSKLIARLRKLNHEAVPASPGTGVNAVTGEGLVRAMRGAEVVVDVSNSPSFAPDDVLKFFEVSTRNLIAAEKDAGVRHHVALSIVGTDRVPGNGYLRAKMAQEKLIAAGGIPYSIVRATQFFEFIGAIADTAGKDPQIRLSSAQFQPIAAEDVADALRDTVLGAPRNGIVEIAGPDRNSMAAIVAQFLAAKQDHRQVIPDPQAPYFGAPLEELSLVPQGSGARLGAIHFADWLRA